MRKFLLLTAGALLIFISVTKAQNSFGIQAGGLGSRSAISGGGSNPDKTDILFEFKAGVYAELSISDRLFLSPELNFVAKGGSFETSGTLLGVTVASKTKMKTNYLELPVNLVYKLSQKPQDGGLYFGTGPVIGYGISGNSETTTATVSSGGSTTGSSTTSIIFDGKDNASDGKVHLKPLEIGANVFVGYEFLSGLRFQFQYRPNFSNIATASNSSYKNSYLALTVGFSFGRE
jgi:hypothetical protein